MRRNLILLHLIFAGVMAPAFLLNAISGGLYLVGNKGETTTTSVGAWPATALDFDAADKASAVRAFLAASDIDHDFEYVRDRGDVLELRPTSRTYLSIRKDVDGVTVTRHAPNLQKSMIELHKGHGPQAFKIYSKAVALALIGVVLGGVAVGLLSPVWRNKTLISLAVGTAAFVLLAAL